MSSEPVISAKHLSKSFRLYKRPEDRLKQIVMPRFLRKEASYYESFPALNDVSLTIGRGETVGIIGRNGAGKSTLLQIICGTLQPSSGELSVSGRIAALLELGAGFNPDFTGRENVYMNGAILGLTKAEIDAKFHEIERFADIGAFIDQAAKTYSSGMYVRLAFAVAIHSDPQILVIDEALSVGDEAFQRKCYARISQLQAGGATILFVSHSAQAVTELCDRALLIDAGEVILEGSPKQVVGQYQRLMNLSGEEAQTARSSIQRMNAQNTLDGEDGAETAREGAQNTQEQTLNEGPKASPDAGQDAAQDPSWYDAGLLSQSTVDYETQGAEIENINIHNSRGERVNSLAAGRRYIVSYDVKFSKAAEGLLYGFTLKSVNGIELGGANNMRADLPQISQVKAGETVKVSFEFNCNVTAGTYFITTGLMARVDDDYIFLHRIVDALAIRVMQGTNPSPYDCRLAVMDSLLTTQKIS